MTGRYDKLRLIPFAEEDVDGLLHFHTGFTAGTGIRLLDTQVGRLGPLVCWEAMYPELSRQLAAAGAETVSSERARPEALRTHLKSEIDRWTPIIKKAGVSAD